MDIVYDSGMDGCIPPKLPFPKGIQLSTDQGILLEDAKPYRRLIGKLLYLNLSRPNLSFYVQQLS